MIIFLSSMLMIQQETQIKLVFNANIARIKKSASLMLTDIHDNITIRKILVLSGFD